MTKLYCIYIYTQNQSISARKMMSSLKINEFNVTSLKIIILSKEVPIPYMPSFQRNVGGIPHNECLNMHFFG